MSRERPGPLAHVQPELAHKDHPVWDEIRPRPAEGKPGGFVPSEFRYPYLMDAHFLRLLYRMRQAAGVPFRITSDHRPPERNAAAGGAERSAHLETPCRAVDLKVASNFERFRIMETAIRFGFNRIGCVKYGADAATGAGIIHLDASENLPAEVIW